MVDTARRGAVRCRDLRRPSHPQSAQPRLGGESGEYLSAVVSSLYSGLPGGIGTAREIRVATCNYIPVDRYGLSSIFLAFAVSAFGITRCRTPSLSRASIRSRSIFSESVKTRS